MRFMAFSFTFSHEHASPLEHKFDYNLSWNRISSSWSNLSVWHNQSNFQVRISLLSLDSAFISEGSTNRCGQNWLWTQLDRHTTTQPVRAVYPVFPLTLQASQRCVCFEGNFRQAKTLNIENYVILIQRNIPTRQRTTLETQQVLFFWETTCREE